MARTIIRRFKVSFIQKSSTTLRLLLSHSGTILSILVIFLVAFFSLSANKASGPLLHLSPQLGTFVLSLFSKATDYAFEASAEVVWKRIQWGPLITGGEQLLSYFVMTGGFESWVKTVLYARPSKDSLVPGKSAIGRLRRFQPQFLSAAR